jgi:PilZ domain-containing protein
VKTLATQTARSTEEISRHIAEVRAATDETVHAVGQIEAAIGEIDQVATAIAKAVEQQGTATEEIARSVAKTTGAAREVATRVASVSAEALRSGAQAEEVHNHLSDLAKAVVDLKHVVVRIARTSTEAVDRRHDPRSAIDLPAEMRLDGSAAVHAVRIKDVSRHGAGISGGPAIAAGARGSLAAGSSGVSLRFHVVKAEATADGNVLHVAFDSDAATARAIEMLLPGSLGQPDALKAA